MSSGTNRKQYEALAKLADGLSLSYNTPTGSFNEKFCELCRLIIDDQGGSFVPIKGTFTTRKADYLRQVAVALGLTVSAGSSFRATMLKSAKAIYDNNNDGGTVDTGASADWITYQYLFYAVVASFDPSDLGSDLLQWLTGTTSPTTVDDSSDNAIDANFVQSPCATFDGSTDKLVDASLAGTETVVTNYGTATPTVGVGEITFTAGTCWGLELDNGSVYTLSENAGDYAYDVSTNASHASITTGAGGLDAFWGSNTQDDYHYFAFNGGTKILEEDGTTEIAISGFAGTETVTHTGTATLTPSAGKITVSGGYVDTITIDGTLTYTVANSYDSTLIASSGASFGNGTITGGAIVQVPAKSDGTNDALDLGLRNPADKVHNGGSHGIRQLGQAYGSFVGGNTSYGEAPSPNYGTGDFAYEKLIRPTGATISAMWLHDGEGSSGATAYLLTPSTLQFVCRNATIDSVDVPFDRQDGRWYLIRFSRVGTTCTGYIKDMKTGIEYSDTFTSSNDMTITDGKLMMNGRNHVVSRLIQKGDVAYLKTGTSLATMTTEYNFNDESGGSIGDMTLTDVTVTSQSDEDAAAIGTTFEGNTFWSADGITYDAKTWADLYEHVNASQNVWVKLAKENGTCYVSDIATTEDLDETQDNNMYNYANSACSAGTLDYLEDVSGDAILDVNGNVIYTTDLR